MYERILIIGGGIIGLLSGRELLRRGHEVTILNSGLMAGSASTGNAGVIAPGHPPIPTPEAAHHALRFLLDPRSPLHISPRASLPLLRWLLGFRRACSEQHFAMSTGVLDRLSKVSRELFDPIIEEAPESLRPEGYCEIARTEEGRAHLQREYDRLAAAGFDVSLVDGDAFRADDPVWSKDINSALIHAEGVAASPDTLMAHLAHRFTVEGGILRVDGKVVRLERQGTRFQAARLESGERCHGDALLVAAGIWTSSLVRRLGQRIPMQAAKGYHVMVDMEEPPRRAALLKEACVVVNPMSPLVRLAGTLELSGINHRMVERRLSMLSEAAGLYLPSVTKAARVTSWNGLRPCTADGLPVIGMLRKTNNAFVATGHAMMGVTLGPGTAHLIADCIEGQPLPDWASPMSPDRY